MQKPREKLNTRGASSLSSQELIQIIVGSGTKKAPVTKLADQIWHYIQKDPEVGLKQLTTIPGLKLAKASKIVAVIELSRRLSKGQELDWKDPRNISLVLAEYAHKKQEHLVVITLDGAGHFIAQRLVAVGTLTATMVHPREVYVEAITDRAASIIIAHNHPSGDPSPSPEDIYVTDVLSDAGTVLGIKLLDHIILGKSKYYSFAENGYLG